MGGEGGGKDSRKRGRLELDEDLLLRSGIDSTKKFTIVKNENY